MKKFLFSRFVAALSLALLTLGASGPIASATGTIGCVEHIITSNS